jgi:adenylate cyclase class IV
LNVLFDTEQGSLAKNGQLLRIRTETPEPTAKKGKRFVLKSLPKQRILLTFKKPPAEAGASGYPAGRSNHKVREEIELEVSDGGTLTKVFEGLGMNGWFRYEKYRTTFQLPASAAWAKGLLIELDETPVGTFVELEGPPAAIDRAAEELGYSKRDYIVKNYLVLYTEACRREGKQPRDMLFDAPK